ncbi:uncharacterized protein LOC143211920 [Lasioglossum baleicum]|uniref:uncharacterized protein LOC143211920 n=1 Tax=Lasioglossum baleicum TaxID=434251 RepID=UPI003FCCFCE3
MAAAAVRYRDASSSLLGKTIAAWSTTCLHAPKTTRNQNRTLLPGGCLCGEFRIQSRKPASRVANLTYTVSDNLSSCYPVETPMGTLTSCNLFAWELREVPLLLEQCSLLAAS